MHIPSACSRYRCRPRVVAAASSDVGTACTHVQTAGDRPRPKLIDRPAQPYATIPIEVTLQDWHRATELFDELHTWLRWRRIEPVGPPFFRHWVIGGLYAKFGLEAGIPVAEPVPADGRVFGDTIAAGQYVTMLHRGHRDGLPNAHAELRHWAEAQGIPLDRHVQDGREVWNGRYEFFVKSFPEESDPSLWETEIAYVVQGSGGSAVDR